MTPSQKLPLRKRPLNLAEALQLRDGIELSQKVLPWVRCRENPPKNKI